MPTSTRKSRDAHESGHRWMANELLLTRLAKGHFHGLPPSGMRCMRWSFHGDKSSVNVASGSMKYSNSAMLNSRRRIIPCRGAISFRYPLPTCMAPNGKRSRKCRWRALNEVNMPCAVSGRRKPALPNVPAPMVVLNIRFCAEPRSNLGCHRLDKRAARRTEGVPVRLV